MQVIAIPAAYNEINPTGLLGSVDSKLFGRVKTKLVDETATIALELVAARIDYNLSRRASGVTVTFTQLEP